MARDNSAKLMIMTKEETKLLIQDLLARLPYSVMCDCPRGSWVIPSAIDVVDLTVYYPCWGEWRPVSECKPYLRELSDMTEEERQELVGLCTYYRPTAPVIGFEDYGIVVLTHHLSDNTVTFKLNMKAIDWLCSNHFDYRGLIPKGLAIKVTPENNPYDGVMKRPVPKKEKSPTMSLDESLFFKKYGDAEVKLPVDILTIKDDQCGPFSSGSNGHLTKIRLKSGQFELYHSWWAYGWLTIDEVKKQYPHTICMVEKCIKELLLRKK